MAFEIVTFYPTLFYLDLSKTVKMASFIGKNVFCCFLKILTFNPLMPGGSKKVTHT